MEIYDVAVVGGGSAGLSAAIFTSRLGLSTIIITREIGGRALINSPYSRRSIENYPGFLSITGLELMSRFDNDPIRQNNYTDFSPGAISKTDNPLDFAIDGNAYFVIETDKGLELTKNGKFKIDQEGFIVTDDGHKLVGQNGYVNLGQDWQKNIQEFVIDTNGEIRINKNIVGKLMIATIDDTKTVERREGLNFAIR
ncbi:MAG: FAD-binding protein, partial [Nitrososphaerales archaeon]